ncbi:MAG: MarR family winged helix-turn-helix transcriptional regulator [Deferribacterales bacterium]
MKHTKKGRLYTDIVLEVFRLSGAFVNEGDELVKHLGLTSARWKVLGALSMADEPMTVAKIAGSMGQTRQGVQRLTDIMEKEGYLRYEDNPHHKKAKLVMLTKEGVELYAKADAIQIEWSNSLSKELDIKDAENALKILKQMYSDIRR